MPLIVETGTNEVKEEFFVMERLGQSLVDVIRARNFDFSLDLVVSLGIQLVDAIQKFHELGYVHCDLKPDNIMVGRKKKGAKV